MPESKLRDKMSKYPIPQNCPEFKAPTLNEELTEKGYLDRYTRKNDTRVLNVQRMVSCAAAAMISAADKLHKLASELAAHIGVGHTARADDALSLTTANEVLTIEGDVIAILGMAHQKLNLRREHQLQSILPKELASICTSDSLPPSDKLFGGDLEKALKSARESFKLTNKSHFGKRFQPYQRQQQAGNPFLSQPCPYSHRGSFGQNRARGVKQHPNQ